MIKLLIYDLDGTLIDSMDDIANAVNAALNVLGLASLPKDLICKFVGGGVRPLITQVLMRAGGRAERVDEAVVFYQDFYSKHLLDHTRLYPSAKQVFEYFKNRKQGIVTNKPQAFSEIILKDLGIDTYFFRVIGGDQKFQKKPSSEGVSDIMASAGAQKDEAVLIGDSVVDVEAGKNAGIKTIGAAYGFGEPEEIKASHPDFIINQLIELKDIPLFN